MKKIKVWDLLFYIITAELIGLISALLSGGFSDFFDVYKKPPLLPPAILFPIVWVILYAIMGSSAYFIDISYARKKDIDRALSIYWTQLLINFSWSIVFFRFQAILASVIIILALLFFVIFMIISFYKINKTAGLINLPYLVWLIFATYLNIATFVIN